MAELVLLLPVLLCLRGLRLTRQVSADGLSRDGTDALRGVLALGILFVHIAQFVPGGKIFDFVQKLGYLVVAGFFFLTGFSLQTQHMTRKDYAKGFLRKRFLAVLLPYLAVTALYWSYYNLLGRGYGILDILRLFAQGKPVVSFSWYIPAVLTFYLAFWALMKMCKQSYPTMVLGGAVWFAVYSGLCMLLKYDSIWYISAFPAVMGMAWATHRQTIENYLKKHYFAVLFPVLAAFIGMMVLEAQVHGGALDALLKGLGASLFVTGLVTLLYRLRLDNGALRVLGRMSMEIYLMQGLALMVLRSRWIYIEGPLLYGLLTAVLTVVFAAVIHIAFKGIPKKPTP